MNNNEAKIDLNPQKDYFAEWQLADIRVSILEKKIKKMEDAHMLVEIAEFKPDKDMKFDPPKLAVCWDYEDKPFKKYVKKYVFDDPETHQPKVICTDTYFKHCILLPDYIKE